MPDSLLAFSCRTIGIGIALGLIFAPAEGSETRSRLAEKAGRIAAAPSQKMNEELREVARKSEQKAGEVGSEVGRKAAEAAVRAVREEVLGSEEKTA